MTDRYTFAPLLVSFRVPGSYAAPRLLTSSPDASPIPSRFAAPLDSGAGGVWLAGEPRPEEYRPGRVILSLPLRDLDLILRPRHRGQRPAGMPRSAWWRLPRRERRQIGGAP